MNVLCPRCGGDRIKVSSFRSLKERVSTLVGTYPLRCRDCSLRFTARIWLLPYWKFARCPKCERMDLSTWSTRYYGAKPLTIIALRLGAKALRCEYCRCNFASFRILKEKFTFRKKRISPSSRQPSEQEAEA